MSLALSWHHVCGSQPFTVSFHFNSCTIDWVRWARARLSHTHTHSLAHIFSVWFLLEKNSCHDRFISIYNDPLRQQVIDARAGSRAHICAHTRSSLKNMFCSRCWKLRMNFSFLLLSIPSTAHQVVFASSPHSPDPRTTHFVELNWIEMQWKKTCARDSNLFCYLMICDRCRCKRARSLCSIALLIDSRHIKLQMCTHTLPLPTRNHWNAFRWRVESFGRSYESYCVLNSFGICNSWTFVSIFGASGQRHFVRNKSPQPDHTRHFIV